MNKGQGNFIQTISTENAKFCVIALTGKVRAGTSDVCKLLTDVEFPDRATQPADTSDYSMRGVREDKIVYRYLHHNWRPFIHLSTTDLIVSFILESGAEKMGRDIVDTASAESAEKVSIYDVVQKALKNVRQEEIQDKVIKISNALQNERNWQGIEEEVSPEMIRERCGEIWTQGIEVEKLLSVWEQTQKNVENEQTTLDDFIICFGLLSVLRAKIRNILGKNNYTIAFQRYGNNIRAYGKAIEDKEEEIKADNLFKLPERINQYIKMLCYFRNYAKSDSAKSVKEQGNLSKRQSGATQNPVFVVINNFKNIFEAYYFKKRYSSFYMIAVSCDEEKRRSRFEDMNKFRLAELRENLSQGKRLDTKIKERFKAEEIREGLRNVQGINDAEAVFLKEIYQQGNLIKKTYDKNIANFILQDVVTCVENADIFVKRDYNEDDYRCDYLLIRQLARIVTLILHPGLLTPTNVEQCMQIAMTAKLSSGCLSRQVGAVVTDSQYNILSLGWNDVPCGDESCIRRNLYDLFRKHDNEPYSQYELRNEEFRTYLEVIEDEFNERKKDLHGLPMAFCFKDIYQDMIGQRDQIYTRALHGEERALVSCDKDRVKGGYLFTTSSPCELCAKKAKDAQISKIYYIEQYPGISRTHIISCGERPWARYELFVGAVGTAYVKLYTPVMPYKDELAILDFSPKSVHNKLGGPDTLPKGEDDKNRRTDQNEDLRQCTQIRQDD